VFSIGDPKRATPKGNPVGTPVVNGAGQSGYTLATRGWTASATGVLLDGDCIQIGYRLHRVTADANADSSGHATLAIWPPLRETPADGATIQTSNCKGIFRLVASTGNKSSTTTSSLFGLSGFQIREAL